MLILTGWFFKSTVTSSKINSFEFSLFEIDGWDPESLKKPSFKLFFNLDDLVAVFDEGDDEVDVVKALLISFFGSFLFSIISIV